MIQFIRNYLTRSKAIAANKLRKKKFLEWGEIKSIALILDKETSYNKSKLDEFIASLGVFTEVFYCEINSKTPSYNDWNCLTKKDKNIWALPAGVETEKIKKKKFDLVISLNRKSHLYSAYLTSILDAVFKIGTKDVCGELDIIIETETGKSPEQDLNEILRYLKMIKTK